MQFPGFGGNGRADGSTEIERQVGRRSLGQLHAKVGANISYEQAPRRLMKGDWATEKSWKQGREGCQRHQSSTIFEHEVSEQVSLFAADPVTRFARSEFCVDPLISKLPVMTIDLRGDRAKRFQNLEQADVVHTVMIDDRKGVVSSGGV